MASATATWYRLLPIDGSAGGRDASLLDVFSPEAVRQSEPTRRLLDYERPTAFLKAVDEALVERLDAWREEGGPLYHSRGAVSRIDEQLQTLYAQLFVLRTVEDRNLDETIPPTLEAATSPETFDRHRWTTIFDRARRQIGSDLFAENARPSRSNPSS